MWTIFVHLNLSAQSPTVYYTVQYVMEYGIVQLVKMKVQKYAKIVKWLLDVDIENFVSL